MKYRSGRIFPLYLHCKDGLKTTGERSIIRKFFASVSRSVVSDSFVTPWTVACQAPLSMGFSRQEYWSGLPFPSLRDLPNPGIKPESPALQVDSLPLSHWVC